MRRRVNLRGTTQINGSKAVPF